MRQKRLNPNVLFPGDRLFIPDREERVENRPTDQRHRFVLEAPRLNLLRVTAEGERARSQAIVRRLLRQCDAVLLVYDEGKDKAALLGLLAEETGRAHAPVPCMPGAQSSATSAAARERNVIGR